MFGCLHHIAGLGEIDLTEKKYHMTDIGRMTLVQDRMPREGGGDLGRFDLTMVKQGVYTSSTWLTSSSAGCMHALF